MTLAQLINRTCVILIRSDSGSTNIYGDDLDDETAVETVCEMQPRSAIEPDGDFSEEEWVGFFLPADYPSLDSASAVWTTLGTFEVVGMPAMWRNPLYQADEYVRANLKRTVGPDDSVGS